MNPGDTDGRRDVRPLVGVLAAIAVSWTGTRISAIALPWFVLVTTGSASQTGVVAFCEMTPYVVVKAFSGPIVDRTGPRRISWTTDLVSAGAAAAVVLLHTFGTLSFPLLLALVAVIGAARGPGDLAKEIMVPEAADHARVPLERATGFSGSTERLASTIGPAAGGALVALVGPIPALVANAACFSLGSLIIAVALPRGMGRGTGHEPRDDAAEPGYWQRFGEGFAFLRADALLSTVVVMVAFTNLLDAAFSTVLLPVWAKESGHGPSAIGLNNSVSGITAICGSLIAAAVAHRMRRRVVFFGGYLLAGAPKFLILASGAPTWAVLAVFAASGFGGGFLNPILGAVSLERVPRQLLGRVGALGDGLAWAGIPLGGLIAGAAVASVGLAPVLVVSAGAYFLTTNLTGLRPEWREMDRLRGKGQAPGPPETPTTAAAGLPVGPPPAGLPVGPPPPAAPGGAPEPGAGAGALPGP